MLEGNVRSKLNRILLRGLAPLVSYLAYARHNMGGLCIHISVHCLSYGLGHNDYNDHGEQEESVFSYSSMPSVRNPSEISLFDSESLLIRSQAQTAGQLPWLLPDN